MCAAGLWLRPVAPADCYSQAVAVKEGVVEKASYPEVG